MKIFLSLLTLAGAACIIAGAETSAALVVTGIVLAAAGVVGAALYTYITNPEEFEHEWKW